jgi:hypothetical protein
MGVNQPMGLNALEGSLGVVKLTFNNVSLGKSMGECTIEHIEDKKEIKHDQDGTQPFDYVITGQAWKVKVPLSEITIARMQAVTRGITIASGGSTSMGKDMFRSCRDNHTYKLILKRVMSDGSETTDPMYIINFYKAFPYITAPLKYSVDGQRVMEVEFYVFEDTANKMFGYVGYNSSLGLTA